MENQFVNKVLYKDVSPEEISAAFECDDFRIFHPYDIITMDYDTNRVNIVIDNSNVILRVYIG